MKIKYILNVNESAPDGTIFSGMQVEEPIRDYAVVSNVYSGWVDDVQEHMGDNYSFKEWNTERDGSGTAYHTGDKLYESTTLYTIWNGETLMPETMEILKGDKRYWLNVLTNFERTKISNALTASSVREYDVVDYSDWAEWESGNSYEVGDRVKYTYTIVHTSVKGWICIVANSSDTLETTEWKQVTRFPTPGEKDVLYIAKLENKAYYWDVDEEEYVCVGASAVIMTGATSSSAGTAGYVPAPSAGDEEKFLKGDGTWDNVDALPVVTSSDNNKVLEVVNGEWTTGSKKIDKEYNASGYSNKWEEKSWNGLTNPSVEYIWTDGENIYYSNGSNHYVLDKATSTWSAKTWTGLTQFYGERIWTNGEDVYYSAGTNKQYVLDKSTSTWTTKTWYGCTFVDGRYVWSDGDNIHYDQQNAHYVLDGLTSNWEEKTWINVPSNFTSKDVWFDGENIYYSANSNQYVLNKSTSTWSEITWTGISEFSGRNVWSDGTYVYCNGYDANYNTVWRVLDSSTSTWLEKTWSGLDWQGKNIWTDGDDIYYSNNTYQYTLLKNNQSKILLGQNGEFNPVNASEVLPSDMTGASSSAAGTHGLVPAPAAGDEDKFLKGDGTWGP